MGRKGHGFGWSPVALSLCLNALVAGGLWLAYISTLNLPPLPTWLVVVNLQLLALLGKDKLAATQAWSRTPELTFFTLALVGASPALLLGRYLFRHKTKKDPFVAVMAGIVALQVAALVWWSGPRLGLW
jgi:uncharacterized membrane protein YsdA (DUF1294 family)